MYPKFLLRPTVFRNRQPNVGSRGSTSEVGPGPSLETNDGKCLDGHVSRIRCLCCAADICFTSQIISKGFTGRYGRAFLVSGEPMTSAITMKTSPIDSLPNTLIQKPVPRRLVTGAHTVGDINCALCGNVLGWKYVTAEEESQRYKVGKFILETERIMTSSSWESPSYIDSAMLSASPGSGEGLSGNSGNSIEFDSQNEDECEDLFAGVWSPGLAMRRRNRKLPERRPSIFGMTTL
ncbi:yippee/mis18 family protein [Aspergillus ibericus CBS 121593]|uniref:Yippee-domain-containing protein n=1 Tax=Aspergillus ibericus CBS 121593 TaxID=1448316 RepID=A0A395HDH0_9EURO|nr:yippee-domain-containing protein [Aspergillus ibericus CBS 121593]RAL05038.1 yippee-domain-containing protein [Aspergillus ibericus CBS 121593]